MNVLSIQTSGKRGGPSIQHLNFITETSRIGLKHYVFVKENHEMIAEYRAVCCGVRTYESMHGLIPRTLSPVKWVRYLKLMLSLRNRIAEYSRDVEAGVIWTLNEAFPAGPLASRKAEVCSATQFFGMTSYKPKLVGLILVMFHKYFSDVLIPCQSVIKDDLTKLGYPKERIHVVHNGVNTDELASRVREKENANGQITVAMVAGLDRRKGHLFFVEAAAVVHKSEKNVVFNIHGSLDGDQDYHDEIVGLIETLNLENVVILTGPVPSVHDCLASSDIFCIPSRIEALSVAGLEAMAIGLPIVATDVGGNSIAVVHNENGYLSAVNDPDDMAQAIIQLCRSEKLRETFGQVSKAMAVEKFSMQVVASELKKALGKL